MTDDLSQINDLSRLARATFGQQSESSPSASLLTSDAPFLIEHRQEDRALSGTFRPSARLILTQYVRISGLWRVLTPEDFKTLVLLLTFVTPNGWCRPTLPELAEAMEVSHAKAKARMERLLQLQWQEQPLVQRLERPDGLDAYLPGRRLLAHENAPAPEPPQPAPIRTAGREAVVAYSRARYATPRVEVEADIARRMGWGAPAFEDDPPEVAEEKQGLYDKLSEQGMSRSQALDVLGRFDLAVVRQQLEWMPHRAAKNPSRYLQAAIENNYEAPVAVRVRQEPHSNVEDIKASL